MRDAAAGEGTWALVCSDVQARGARSSCADGWQHGAPTRDTAGEEVLAAVAEAVTHQRGGDVLHLPKRKGLYNGRTHETERKRGEIITERKHSGELLASETSR